MHRRQLTWWSSSTRVKVPSASNQRRAMAAPCLSLVRKISYSAKSSRNLPNPTPAVSRIISQRMAVVTRWAASSLTQQASPIAPTVWTRKAIALRWAATFCTNPQDWSLSYSVTRRWAASRSVTAMKVASVRIRLTRVSSIVSQRAKRLTQESGRREDLSVLHSAEANHSQLTRTVIRWG